MAVDDAARDTASGATSDAVSEEADARSPLEELLETDATGGADGSKEASTPAFDGLRSARVKHLEARRATIVIFGEELSARVAPDVDPKLIHAAVRERHRVLVEGDGRGGLLVVGMLQTRIPEHLELSARKITIDAEEHVTLRSGRAGLRMRRDGDVELVASRITAASRGLFKLVGRMLRLN